MSAAQVLPFPEAEQQLLCTYCGAVGEAPCRCHPQFYVSAKPALLAKTALEKNPRWANNRIAEEIGVSYETVARMRRALIRAKRQGLQSGVSTSSDEDVETLGRVGKDGKTRVLPHRRRKEPPTTEMPTAAEAEEDYQATLYDHATWIVDDKMSKATRAKFFAYLKKRYEL